MTNQEINEAVARKLGYSPLPAPEYEDHADIESRSVYTFKYTWLNPDGKRISDCPNYCEEISAAWDLLQNKQFSVSRVPKTNDLGFEYECNVVTGPFSAVACRSESASTAICLVFLRLP